MPKPEDAAAAAARTVASVASAAPAPREAFVVALEPIDREGGHAPVGAVFRPRDADERASLGARVRPATDRDLAIAAIA